MSGTVVSSAALPFEIAPILGDAVYRAPTAAVAVETRRGVAVSNTPDVLAEALAAGDIQAAALDVLERESAVHEALRRLRRASLAPHAGSATTTARRRMAETCARAVRAVLDGRVPDTAVNREVYE